jgi:hypothetical protein
MPVWHVSIARLNRKMDGIIPVSEWPNTLKSQASELKQRVLSGVGGQWERHEIGDMAVHLRRRLSREEMKLLHQVNSTCPVFTHGAALAEVLA